MVRRIDIRAIERHIEASSAANDFSNLDQISDPTGHLLEHMGISPGPISYVMDIRGCTITPPPSYSDNHSCIQHLHIFRISKGRRSYSPQSFQRNRPMRKKQASSHPVSRRGVFVRVEPPSFVLISTFCATCDNLTISNSNERQTSIRRNVRWNPPLKGQRTAFFSAHETTVFLSTLQSTVSCELFLHFGMRHTLPGCI